MSLSGVEGGWSRHRAERLDPGNETNRWYLGTAAVAEDSGGGLVGRRIGEGVGYRGSNTLLDGQRYLALYLLHPPLRLSFLLFVSSNFSFTSSRLVLQPPTPNPQTPNPNPSKPPKTPFNAVPLFSPGLFSSEPRFSRNYDVDPESR